MNQLNQFLLQHNPKDAPFLLALSGGPDSLALFYMLLEIKKLRPINFAIAHVDHGWRAESGAEAAHLETLAAQYGIRFYLKKLYPDTLKGNLEAACRNERLQFFKETCHQEGFQAVMMGHHADDQAETVLKRIFEGSRLGVLSGLQPITDIDELIVWRPLLTRTKLQIREWLTKQGKEAFEDATNDDVRFLRARMRGEILPYLRKSFGKEVSGNLCRLSDEVSELKEYLDSKISHYLSEIVQGPFGSLLDLSTSIPERYELRYLLETFFTKEKVSFSKIQMQQMIDFLESGAANKQFKNGQNHIIVDRRRVFNLKREIQAIPEGLRPLKEGRCGPWKIAFVSKNNSQIGWKAVWQGVVSISLPPGDYQIGRAILTEPYSGATTTLDRWWNKEKVPAFLRNAVPVLWKDGKIVKELLSERNCSKDVSDLAFNITYQEV